MRAAGVMTSNVITVQPDTEVREMARVLLKYRIRAGPVVDAGQRALAAVLDRSGRVGH